MSERFTIHLDQLEKSLRNGNANGIEIGRCVVTNGCFDIMHAGHISILASLDTIAYRDGLRPIVAINSDQSVRRLKGNTRPRVPQESRSLMINHLKWPLTVVIFDEDTPQRLMDLLQPAIVVKGDEYNFDSVVKWKDSKVELIPMVSRFRTSEQAALDFVKKWNESHRAMTLTTIRYEETTTMFQTVFGKDTGISGPAWGAVSDRDDDNIHVMFMDDGRTFDMISCGYGDANWVEVRLSTSWIVGDTR